MQISLAKSTIRPFRPEDAQALRTHIDNYQVARNMSAIPHPYSLQHADEWIATASAASPQTHFAIAIDDKVVGGIGVIVDDGRRGPFCAHCAEIGYWLGQEFWGRGILSEAVPAFTEWAFSELRLVRLFAAVYARNPASARVLEKSGYTFEGRLCAVYFRDDEFIDGLLYAKVRFPF
jgi:[ribosomal protein S5]-alanine N-acetyltransferase